MEQEGLRYVAQAAATKMAFFRHRWEYVVYSMIAGAFCSIGMAFAYSVGAAVYANPASQEMYRLAIGIAFSLSFTLITFAGCELFTSNVFVMSIGALSRSVRTRDAAGLLFLCYLANLFGAAFMALVFAATGLLDGPTGQLLVKSSAAKASLAFIPAFFRGVLCNILVCLGYWAMSKAKSEAAKLIIIVWVVAGFVTPGYEHSIANAGIFTMALAAPYGASAPGLQLDGIAGNLIPVTLGNFVGGAFLVALPYWVSGRTPEQ